MLSYFTILGMSVHLWLLALCLVKIVVRAFPTALRHATACSLSNEDCGESISHRFEGCYCLYHGIDLLLVLHFPRVIWMCPLGQQQREKGERHTGSLTVSC